MTTESERRKHLLSAFKDGYIPAELDNPLALGLIEKTIAGEIYERIIGRPGSRETDFYVSPTENRTFSPEELTNFTEAFTKEIAKFTQVNLVGVRQIISGGSNEIYDSAVFQYEEERAYGRIIIYPSKTHVNAVAEADNLEGLQQDSNINFKDEISSLRKAFPK